MKKITTALAIGVIAAVCVSGCGKGGKDTAGLDFEVTTDGSYPIETDQKITYWSQLHESVAANFGSLNETDFAKELIKETGINVEFIHPPISQTGERFNLMIASDDLPDIIEWGWYNFSGGPQKAIDDNIIIPLNTVFEKAAPNFSAYIKAHPEAEKEMKTDSGNFYAFPMVRETDYLNTYYGPMFRKDLLDKAGITKVPETIDEWDEALYAFKDLGVKTPLAIALDNATFGMHSAFLGAYGVKADFYIEDGKVKFGPADEDKYTKVVELFTRWYKDGILDQNFIDTTPSKNTNLGVSGEWGATFGSCGGNYGSWIPTIKKSNPEAEFVPAKYPVLNAGERPKFGQKNFSVNLQGGNAAISTQCKNIELATRLLDYGYSEKGNLLYNFGTEGVSFNMVNDVPTYTDQITNQEVNGGQPMSYMIARYARGSYFGPMIQDEDYMRQYAQLDVQKEGIDLWLQNDNTEYSIPYVTMTAEENAKYSSIVTEIFTYREEIFYKIITGAESIDILPTYYENIKNMGLDEAISILQTAYERYLDR